MSIDQPTPEVGDNSFNLYRDFLNSTFAGGVFSVELDGEKISFDVEVMEIELDDESTVFGNAALQEILQKNTFGVKFTLQSDAASIDELAEENIIAQIVTLLMFDDIPVRLTRFDFKPSQYIPTFKDDGYRVIHVGFPEKSNQINKDISES